MATKIPDEEARPLLPDNPQPLDDPPQPKPSPMAAPPISPPAKWAAEGLPLCTAAQGTVVMGSPLSSGGRDQWNSSICACLGRNDEFCSSDVEVCLLGSLAPCVLYGSNAERLGAAPASFANNCLSYSGIYLLGSSLFGWNCLAPWFSYPTRSAIRRSFNLEGSCEALSRSCGCCTSVLENEVRREQVESACDLATHLFCHPCALCQEGRELRRRLPHPGFNGRSIVVVMPPMEQTMGRDV